MQLSFGDKGDTSMGGARVSIRLPAVCSISGNSLQSFNSTRYLLQLQFRLASFHLTCQYFAKVCSAENLHGRHDASIDMPIKPRIPMPLLIIHFATPTDRSCAGYTCSDSLRNTLFSSRSLFMPCTASTVLGLNSQYGP